jgi:hypothetical protein
MLRLLPLAAAAAAALTLAGCAMPDGAAAPAASAAPSCPDGPWRATGLADGSAGLQAGFGAARLRACREPAHGARADAILDRYLSGHAEGVAVYCAPASAHRLGRERRAPTLSCPMRMEGDFAAAYAAGAAGAPVPSAAGAPVPSAAGAPVPSAAGAPVPSAAGALGSGAGTSARPWPLAQRIRPSVSIGIGAGGRVSTGLGVGLLF